MLKINIDGNLGNQEVILSDKSTGQLTGIRAFGAINSANEVVQWTFIPANKDHESFVFAGNLYEGLVIESINGKNQYKIHFKK